MSLSKIIPARKETIKAHWCKKDFMKMSDRYKQIRKGFKNPMTSCFWCKHQFVNDEMMALACIKGKGNKVFCQKCADNLMEPEAPTE